MSSSGLRLPAPVQALEQGDWRTALAGLDQAPGGLREVVHLELCARLLAHSMRSQAVGDVAGAQARLDEAQRAYTVATGRPRPGARPRATRSLEHAVWLTGAVLERERAELEALRRAGREVSRGQQELLLACVEHLTWVDLDPFSVRPGADDGRLLGLDPQALERFGTGNRIDLCRRATDLRHFADVYTGSVSERTWQRMGGYRVIRAEALQVLAAEPVLRARPPLAAGPRLGRLRAWEYARRWCEDTSATRAG